MKQAAPDLDRRLTPLGNSREDVEWLSKLLYDEQLRQAREEISKIEFDFSDSVQVMRNVRTESDTGIAIITVAYFDECFYRLLMCIFSDGETGEKLLNINGALGSFGARTDLAFSLNCISRRSHEALTLFRKIRNDFAHEPFGVTFETPKIRSRVNAIKIDYRPLLSAAQDRESVAKRVKHPDHLTIREQFQMKAILTLSQVTSELLANPVASRHQVSPNDILRDHETLPKNLKEIRLSAADCIFEIFEKKGLRRRKRM